VCELSEPLVTVGTIRLTFRPTVANNINNNMNHPSDV
jgi:hypothetical protein